MVIVGHLNKGGGKNQYRGLGSVDIFAAARSVLTLGRVKGQPTVRAFAHGKSNLAPEGGAIAFELDPEAGFRWIGKHSVTIDELLGGFTAEPDSAYDRAAAFLQSELAEGEQPAAALFEKAAANGIAERTIRKAKSALGVRSFKRQDKWFGALD
ncbi:MAG: hypothetical protein LIO58_02060 [Oscillospiraceae bacterium]|nr:hypothetical protein [Oscillospiraceae bacterium]